MTSFFEYKHGSYRVLQVPILDDNYVYIICYEDQAIVVDPGRIDAVNKILQSEGLKASAIINTHHHWDHTDGNIEFVQQWNCPIYGFSQDAQRIPGITHKVQEADILSLGPLKAKVLFIPGHTVGHIAYYFEEQSWLFSGDTLFSLGCGRLFEGTAEQMHRSLQSIRSLPRNTQIFCTHEYTEDNLKFSQSLLPGDLGLQKAQQRIQSLLSKNCPTVPMTLAEERESNLFLRWDDQELRQKLGLTHSEDWQVFAAIRSKKDSFR